jgi:hypothetical protein
MASLLAMMLHTSFDFKYMHVRKKLADLLASAYQKQAPKYDGVLDFLLQAFCAFCLRAQEVDTILWLREEKTGIELRYQNPCRYEFGCEFLELDESDLEWKGVGHFDLGLDRSRSQEAPCSETMERI